MKEPQEVLTEQLKAIDDEAERLKAEVAKLRAARRPLQEAIRALKGHRKNTHPAKPEGRRQRKFKGRKAKSERRLEVLDWLRAHPNEQVSASALSIAGLGPQVSIQGVLNDLLEEGTHVDHVGSTGRGQPVVKYRPMTVRPGEEVKG